MRIDEALLDTAAQIDVILAKAFDNFEGALIEHGATDAELAAEMEIARAAQAAERARILGLVRELMLRDGKSLQ